MCSITRHILSGKSEYEALENLGNRTASSEPRKLKESMAWLSLSVIEGDLVSLPPCLGGREGKEREQRGERGRDRGREVGGGKERGEREGGTWEVEVEGGGKRREERGRMGEEREEGKREKRNIDTHD